MQSPYPSFTPTVPLFICHSHNPAVRLSLSQSLCPSVSLTVPLSVCHSRSPSVRMSLADPVRRLLTQFSLWPLFLRGPHLSWLSVDAWSADAWRDFALYLRIRSLCRSRARSARSSSHGVLGRPLFEAMSVHSLGASRPERRRPNEKGRNSETNGDSVRQSKGDEERGGMNYGPYG